MIFPQDYCKAAMLNKNIARNLRKTATDWEIEFITDRPELYERIFKRNRNCDEGNITQVKGTK